MSSPNNKRSAPEKETEKKKASPPPSTTRFVKGRSNVRPTTSRSGVRPINFDAKNYDNGPIKLTLVVPGNPEMTMACNPCTIPAKRFMVGTNHDLTHNAVKQAIYTILVQSLSQVFTLDREVKDGLMALVESLYGGKSISAETFRFSPYQNPSQFFNFAAISRFVSRQNQETPIVHCVCPPIFAEYIWDLTDSILEDGPSDEEMQRHLPFLSPPIRQAHPVHAVSILLTELFPRYYCTLEFLHFPLHGEYGKSRNREH